MTSPIEWETFAQCTECGGRMYRREDEAGQFFQCDTGCDPLVDRDILLEWDEAWAALPDETGRLALKHYGLNTATDEDDELSSPEPAAVTGCMYARSGNGPCGGPVTNRGDGYDYCWQHKHLRLPPG